MSRFTAAGVPISVLNTPTSFLYGAQASEGVAYVVNASSNLEFVQISDSTGNPGHPVPLIPGEWVLLPYGAYNTIKTTSGSLVYAQPGFLNKKQSLFLSSGEDIFNEEAQNIFQAFTTPATTGRKHLINMTVGALKEFSLWDTSPFFHVLAAETDQAARINWKTPGTFTLANITGTPTFAADRGFTVGSAVNASLGVNGTLITHTDDAIKYTIGAFVWNLTGAVPGGAQFDAVRLSSATIDIGFRPVDIFGQIVSPNIVNYNHGSNLSIIASFHSARSLLQLVDAKSINRRIYRNGALIATANNSPTTGNTSTNLRFGSFTGLTGDFELALGGFFYTTTDIEHLRMYQVFQAYLSIIGAI